MSLLNSDDLTAENRYVAWYHELDAWTEYWDIYHPETKGHYYFGDNDKELGLLTQFLPRQKSPPAFEAWKKMALYKNVDPFIEAVRVPEVASAIIEIDALLDRLFNQHFGNAADSTVQTDYLKGILRFATNSLPPAIERDAKISDSDPRKSTAGHHTLEGDMMWFAWALQTEAAYAISGIDNNHSRHCLLLAGISIGCPANFAWKCHRRTRPEYQANAETLELLLKKGMVMVANYHALVNEIHALYQIREWGCEL
jgi:hypothetical protein